METQTVVPVLWDRRRNFAPSSLLPPLQNLGERAISLPPTASRASATALRPNPYAISSDDSPRSSLGYAQRLSIDVPPSPLDSRSKSMLSPRPPPMKTLTTNFRTINSLNQGYRNKDQKLSLAPSSPRLSPPRPTRKAVLISLTYVHNSQVKSLPSCAKQVSRLYDLLLLNLCFYKENIWVLSDEPRIVPGAVSYTATRANIDNSLKWLMSGIGRGDQLMFYYCGQAALLRSIEKGRSSGPEYCVIPADFPSAAAIPSSYLSKTLVDGLRDGATLTALFDCRHSEKLMKMPFIHSITRSRRRKFSLEEELDVPIDQLVSPRGIVLSSIFHRMGRYKREVEERKKAAIQKRNKDALSLFDKGTVICIAASAEFVADSPLGVQARNHGILTSSFVSYMKHASGEEGKTDYRTMLCEMASWMFSKGELRLPMLHCSHNISPNMEVTLFSE